MGQLWIPLWPLAVACLMQLAAAAVNLRTLFVPNNMSLAGVLAAWLLGASALVGGPIAIGGDLAATIAATLLGGGLILPFYVMGGLGAGCVKMQAAFGAWIGCALPPGAALFTTAVATVGGVLLTVLTIGLYALLQRLWPEDRRAKLFPAQVTLAIGSIAALAAHLTLMHGAAN